MDESARLVKLIRVFSDANHSGWIGWAAALIWCELQYYSREKEMKYCVTGGSGFIAFHCLTSSKPSSPKATLSEIPFLWDMEGAKERLELVRADLTVEESFDEAIDGVDGVFHTASPVFPSNQHSIQVDAALDLSHTQNIGTMIKAHFPHSQFIVVSLKEGMFNNANVIFWIKFVDGVSTVTRTVPSKQK